MGTVKLDVVEKIIALAYELPDEQRQQLLELTGSWKPDVRQASREPYSELLNFTSKTGSHYGHARDISATGVFIESPAECDVGQQVKLILTFISAPNPVRLTGTIVRKTTDGFGVQFDDHSRERISELDNIISKHALILHHQ